MEEFNKLFEEYSDKLENLIAEQVKPIMEDHEKLVEYIEKNKNAWDSTKVQALEKSVAECYKKIHALQSAYRFYLLVPFDHWLDMINYSSDLLDDMKKSTALKTDMVLQAACKGLYKNFPLHACPAFKLMDEDFNHILSKIIKEKMSSLRDIYEESSEEN